MKINQIISETTTSGSVATVSTPLGGTQSRGNPSIYGGKKVGTLFKGKKTSAPYANSINESADLSEAELQEDDVILVPGQGRKSKTGFVPHGQSRVDHEVEMARSDLFSAAKNAQQVYTMIKELSEDEGLEGWVQEKIIKANDYLNTVREYLEGKQAQGVAEDDAHDIEQRMLIKIEKEKQRLVKLKQTDPEAYKREIAKHKQTNRMPAVSTFEGAKVDRMVKHITKSEKKLGHSKKEAENIAWATANKRGMLDNKNKKA
jgi:hypothetical protein